MGTPIEPPLQGPVLRAIELTQKAPECFTNDGGTEPVGNLARDKCIQTLKGEWPTHPLTNTQLPTPSVWGRRQSTGSVAWQRHLTPVRPEFPAERAAVGY